MKFEPACLARHADAYLPPDISGLPEITPEPWVLIDPDAHQGLEGPAFDVDGNFYVCRTTPPVPNAIKKDAIIVKVTQNREQSVFFNAENRIPVCIAIHKDGRFFVGCLGGELLILGTKGELLEELILTYDGQIQSINDMVFDRRGNLYYTDFRGYANNPIGGVYRFSIDNQNVTQIAANLASPNGIALSPEGDCLWVAEAGRNVVLRIELTEEGLMAPFAGFAYVYTNVGATAPDSNKVDSAGNLYQGIMPGGRIIVLNRYGIPVRNIIVPGAQEGKNLATPNLALKPDTSEGYMIAGGSEGCWIYRFPALAPALVLYSHS